MIYITGDTHGYIDFEKLEKFAEDNPSLTKKDYIIIAGDFGGVWDSYTLELDLEPYRNLPFSILFVDGNHENFDLLYSFPVEKWNGGKIHKIKDDIIHLLRGQVFSIEGKTFFTFGGGTSIDKVYRSEYHNWWRQEMPTIEELNEAIGNLKNYNNKVDYIITHAIDEQALLYSQLHHIYKGVKVFPDNKMLSYFENNVDYKHWYFGHYHIDCDINEKKTAIYQRIIMI